MNSSKEENLVKGLVAAALKANPPKKTRICRGTTARRFRKVFPKTLRNLITWAVNLKPGDRINSFDGLNHIVKSVRLTEWYPVYHSYGKKGKRRNSTRGYAIQNIYVETTDGWSHNFDEGTIDPAYPIEAIEESFTKECVQKMIEFGIIDKDGNRLRSATTEENKTINEIYEEYKIGPKSA